MFKMSFKENYGYNLNIDSPILNRLKEMKRVRERHREISNNFISTFRACETSNIMVEEESPANSKSESRLSTVWERGESRMDSIEAECVSSVLNFSFNCDQSLAEGVNEIVNSPSKNFSVNTGDSDRSVSTEFHNKLSERIKSKSIETDLTEKEKVLDANNWDISESLKNISYGSPFLKKYPTDEVESYVPKFSFLKKGEGTSRFGTKIKKVKKFKKKESLNKFHPIAELSINKPIITEKSEYHFQEKKSSPHCKNAFERLEELATHDSFSMESSKVMEFAEEADKSFCSTPIMLKNPLVSRNLNFSPITNNYAKEKKNIVPDVPPVNSAVNALRSGDIPLNLSPIMRELQTVMKHQPNQGSENDMVSPGSGILKKTSAKLVGSVMYSPISTPKVHFEKAGAKILEYNDQNESIDAISSVCNDSDLINISDLEYLAVYNCNFELVEISNDAQKKNSRNGSFHELSDGCKSLKTSSEMRKNQNFDSNDCKILDTIKKDHILNDNNLIGASNNLLHIDNYNKPIVASKTPKDNENYDVDTDACKVLLMSKVEELNKEIHHFEMKNKKMEQIMNDLHEEKQILIKEKTLKKESVKNLNSQKAKSKTSINSENKAINKKIDELNEKQNTLSSENVNLKRMVTSLQRKAHGMEKIIAQQKSLITEKLNNSHENNKPSESVKCKVRGNNASALRLTNNRQLSKPLCKPKVNSLGFENLKEANKTSKNLYKEVCNNEYERKDISPMSNIKSVDRLEGSLENIHLDKHALSISEEYIDQIGKYYELYKTNSEELTNKPKLDEIYLKTSTSFQEHPAKYSDNMLNEEEFKAANTIAGKEFTSPYSHHQSQQYDLNIDRQYSHSTSPPHTIMKQTDNSKSPELIQQITHDNGCEEFHYSNGNSKIIYVDGVCIYQYSNGDKKTVLNDKIVCFYAVDSIMHTKFKGELFGMEVIEFPNSQKETYYPDGSHQIIFSDKSSKTVRSDGSETHVSIDGTITQIDEESKIIEFPNGQKEIYEKGFVTRVYPDGTMKILHPDGTQETRYRNGKVRIKDRDGNIVNKS